MSHDEHMCERCYTVASNLRAVGPRMHFCERCLTEMLPDDVNRYRRIALMHADSDMHAVADSTCDYCHTARDHQPLCPMAAHACGAPHPFRDGMRCQRPRDHQDGVGQLDTHHCRDRGWPATASEMAAVAHVACDVAVKPQRAYPIPDTIGADFGHDGRIILTGTPWPRESSVWEHRDDHADALSYAFSAGFRRAGKTDLMSEIANMALARGLDVREYKRRVLHCGGCDSELDADVAFQLGKPCPLCGWTLTEASKVEPKPPTLREWLGDRVSELGRWADVLREQPVPAGSIVEWRWECFGERVGQHWRLLVRTKNAPGFESLLRTSANPNNHGCGDPFFDAVQMALFTRHPDVKPEPVCEPWSPEDQADTIARDA